MLAVSSPVQPVAAIVDTSPELTPEQQQGGPADPRHGKPLAGPAVYPWEVLPGVPPPRIPGRDGELLDETRSSDPAGTPGQDPRFDGTPVSHAAPWPKGVEQSVDPDAVARQRAQSASIHAANTGASRRPVYRTPALQDQWAGFYTTSAGSSLQDPNVPGQLKASAGGYGTTDRVSSFAQQNQFGFDSAHMRRRYATGSIPGNYMWMKPGGRPLVKSVAGPARPPVGEGSPFAGQDVTAAHGVQGAVLQDAPTEYTPPAVPYIAPTPGPAPEPGPVAWW